MRQTKTTVEFFYDYVKERPLFMALIRAKEAALFQKYKPYKQPVLDLGCGDGSFAKLAFGSLDTGIDLDDSRIGEAIRLGVYEKCITYNGTRLPFNTSSFNTVVSNCVLEHVSDIRTIVSEVYRVLAPGGLFVTSVMAKPWEQYLFGALFLGDLYRKWMRKKQVHINMFGENEWNDIFRSAGFTVEERIGYLDKRLCRAIDMCHYLSVPTLLNYHLFGKWVLFPRISSRLYPERLISPLLNTQSDVSTSGGIFYCLRK